VGVQGNFLKTSDQRNKKGTKGNLRLWDDSVNKLSDVDSHAGANPIHSQRNEVILKAFEDCQRQIGQASKEFLFRFK